MSKIDTLIEDQERVHELMSRSFVNATKRAGWNTCGSIESRIKLLNDRWADVQQRHIKILSTQTDDDGDLDYFKQDFIVVAEETFVEERCKFFDALHALEPEKSNKQSSDVESRPEDFEILNVLKALTEKLNQPAGEVGGIPRSRQRKLPPIDLPTFSGRFHDWPSFKDKFTSCIMGDDSLEDVDRFQYLLSCLSEEASSCIRNIAITNENYQRAWDRLSSYYENKRDLIAASLDILFSVPNLTSESEHGLKVIRDQTNDAIESLEGLKRPVKHWDDILVYMTVRHLDPVSRRDWETSLEDSKEPLKYADLDSFLKTRIKALRRVNEGNSHHIHQNADNKKSVNTISSKPSKSVSRATSHVITKQPSTSCSVCNQAHYIAHCKTFKALDLEKRLSFVVNNNLCYNCLGFHQLKDCRSSKTCGLCQKRHHSLLHNSWKSPGDKSLRTSVPQEPGRLEPHSGKEAGSISSHTTRISSHPPHSIILATARIIIVNEAGRETEIRSLIDPCSQASFIELSTAKRLKLSRQSTQITVSGIGKPKGTQALSEATVYISSRFESTRQWKLQTLVLENLSDYQPSVESLDSDLSFISDLQLADPRLSSRDPIEMIIGADLYTQIISSGLRRGNNNRLIAQQTVFGWIVTGSPDTKRNSQGPLTSTYSTTIDYANLTETSLVAMIAKFWEQEELSPKSNYLKESEIQCEEHYAQTHRRTKSGRYILNLPFNDQLSDLGESFQAAHAMLVHMERKFASDQSLHKLYQDFMTEYIELGHMKPLATDTKSIDHSKAFYLPHHGVLKSSGTKKKLRVVFNGSVKLKVGRNINECLLPGPKLQPDLVDILLRWRSYQYVFSTDITKMFRQFEIAKEDQRYQRILWRTNPSDAIQVYELQTVTYGLVSSPYQAIRTLQQLSLDEEWRFPSAAKLLQTQCYVDDILGGHDSLCEAQNLQRDLLGLAKAGGLHLSKWTSNHKDLLQGIPAEDRAPASTSSWQLEEFQMLGISWQPKDDTFRFHIKNDHAVSPATKRSALSFIAQLFDPLGWISPIIVSFKIFMQSLWHTGLQWDDILPTHLKRQWIELTNGLNHLDKIAIPRWTHYSSNLELAEIHGFADASERAYAAVVYLRTIDRQKNVNCRILLSKTKVSPLKQISIPRLELCGASLLVKLTSRVLKILKLEQVACHLWLDSTIALTWIQDHPTKWKTYVANRVSEIQSSLPTASWQHVRSKENPADLASRGSDPIGLINASIWFSGPTFLTETPDPWITTSNFEPDKKCPEQRRVTSLITTSQPAQQREWELIERYSTLSTLLRVTARCQEFIHRFSRFRDKGKPSYSASNGELTASQLHQALLFWIKHTQSIHFSSELGALDADKKIANKSQLLRLNPIQYDDKILRVGGRLQHSSLLPDEKHPYILPRDSTLTKLLIQDAHLRTLHGGTQLVLNFLRQRFWILRGRQAVKSIIFNCIPCWRQRAQPVKQLMGNLPEARVRPQRPFLHSGVDYAGPFNLRLSHGRGTRTYKGYIAVFVCFTSRAVHLEAASNYSTPEFLNVYRRFTSRRGICAILRSDCGTNFIGASKELQTLFRQASFSQHDVAHFLANDGTEWKFNPPAAPHFGGLWEAAVKSTKYHLKRVINEVALTFEEMTTLLCQIEACLNSRPLQPLNDDPTTLEALTPGNFLIGAPLTTIPEPSIQDRLSLRTRWQLIRRMQEDFWHKWSKEYLHELQFRPKWKRQEENVKVGDLCILRNDLSPACKWNLARIIEVIPGQDGLIRVVRLRTATSTFIRPISKISILPQEDNGSPRVGEGGRNVRK